MKTYFRNISLKTNKFKITIAAIALLLITSISGAQQQGPAIGDIIYKNGDALIQAFVLISSPETVRFSLVGGASEGIKSLQVTCLEKIIARKECFGGKTCRLTGSYPTPQLGADIITVEVFSSTQKEQKEKIKINVAQGGEKVYTITALPDFTGADIAIAEAAGTATGSASAPVLIASATDTTPLIAVEQPLPVITTNVSKKNKNEFDVFVLVSDQAGVDFVELLNDGKFFDVQICNKSRNCQISKNIVLDTPGAKTYTVKTMNIGGKIAFQDIKLSYEE